MIDIPNRGIVWHEAKEMAEAEGRQIILGPSENETFCGCISTEAENRNDLSASL